MRSREVHETGGGSGRDYITVLGAGSADGVRLSHTFCIRESISTSIGPPVVQLAPCME